MGEKFADALSCGIEEELGILIQNENVSVMPEDLKKEWKGKKYLIRRYFINIGDKAITLNYEHDVSIWLSQESPIDMIETFYRS
jgi:hypothetical protein